MKPTPFKMQISAANHSVFGPDSAESLIGTTTRLFVEGLPDVVYRVRAAKVVRDGLALQVELEPVSESQQEGKNP